MKEQENQNEKQEMLVQECMKPFQHLFLKDYSKANLQSYFRYLIRSNSSSLKVTYNFKVLDKKFDKEHGNEFFRAFEKAMQTLDPEFQLVRYEENYLLTRNISTIQQGMHIGLAIASDSDTPISDKEYDQWLQILNKDPNAIKLIYADQTRLKSHFQGRDHLYYRLFPCDIMFRKADEEDILEALKADMDQENLFFNSAFEDGIKAYIHTVYPKADLKGKAFMDDLTGRVLRAYGMKPRNGELDVDCVPDYIKPVEQKSDAEKAPNKSENSIETIRIPHFQENAEPVSATGNRKLKILVLALSTFNNMIERSYRDIRKGKDSGLTVKGAYQLDCIPRLLYQQSYQIIFDEVIVLSTRATSQSREQPTIGNRKYVCADDENGGISELDYFAYFMQHLYENEGKVPRIRVISIPDPDEKVGISGESKNEMLQAIGKLLQEIRQLSRMQVSQGNLTSGSAVIEKKSKPEIYVDIHGGFRVTQQMFIGILYLLRLEGIRIPESHVLTAGIDGRDSDTGWIGNAGITMSMYDFISGLNELENDGKVIALEKFTKHGQESQESEASQNIINALGVIAEGIQMCDVWKFENGLKELKKKLDVYYDPEKKAIKSPDYRSDYLSLFIDQIYDDYKNVLPDDENHGPDVIREIEWALDKGFYQQVLTLIESKTAEYLQNKKIFTYIDADCPEGFAKKHKTMEERRDWLFCNPVMAMILSKEKRLKPLFSKKFKPWPFHELKMKEYEDNKWFKPCIDEGLDKLLTLYVAFKECRNTTNHGSDELGQREHGLNIDIFKNRVGDFITEARLLAKGSVNVPHYQIQRVTNGAQKKEFYK